MASLSKIAANESKPSGDAHSTANRATDGAKKDGGSGAAQPATTARKGPGAKDVVPFVWKLVGESHGAILTLFKATERAEVDSQLERACAEGYYANLRILDIDEKIKQPPFAVITPRSAEVAAKGAQPKPKRKSKAAKKETSKTGKTRRTRKVASKPTSVTKTTKPANKAKRPKTAKKRKAKAPTKPTKPTKPAKRTKKTSTKSTKRRTAKKK